MSRRRLAWLGFGAVVLGALAPVACGGDDGANVELTDAGSDVTVVDVAPDNYVAPVDAGSDTSPDASDAGGDVGTTLDGAACGGGDFGVAKVDPKFGWTGGTTPITITGAGFDATPSVYLRSGTTLISVPKVGYVSATSITAEVPSGLTAGTYDVIVVNPNTCAHVLAAAFIVTSNPPPTVVDVSPGTGTTQADVPVTITGCGFAQGATLSTVSEQGTVVQHVAGTITCADAGTCPNGELSCTMTGTIQDKTKGLATGAYLVRVTNPDGSYGEYSLFAVTEPSGKLPANWVAGPSLVTGRRSHAIVSARINDAARFLYVVGGENGVGNGQALDSVEVASLDKYGTVGTWAIQKNHLPAGRAGHALVRQGRYLYVLGGTTANGGTGGTTPAAPTADILRAQLLDPADAPVLQDPVAGTIDAGGLAKGTWYYKVSAVLASGGETLPSNEGIVVVAQGGTVTLTWSAVPGASYYRIYRSAQANGVSQSEVLLVDNYTNDGGALVYVDSGQATPGTEKPEVRGATGPWQTLGATLFRARSNTAALVEKDPSGQAYVYVLGGWGDCAGGNNNGLMGCGEFATIDASGATLGSFAALSQTFTPRMRHGVSSMNALTGPSNWADAGNPSNAYLFVGGGRGPTTGTTSNAVEHALVQNGGQVGAWTVPGKSFAAERDGDQFWCAVGYVYAFQGGTPPNQYDHTSESAVSVTVGATSITLDNWSNAGANLGGANKRGRHGITLESAHFYMTGGTSNDTDALNQVFQIVY